MNRSSPATVRRWIWILVVIGAAALAALGDVRQRAARLGEFSWPALAAGLGLALANYASRSPAGRFGCAHEVPRARDSLYSRRCR